MAKVEKLIDISSKLGMSFNEVVSIYLLNTDKEYYEKIRINKLDDLLEKKGFIKKVGSNIFLLTSNKVVSNVIEEVNKTEGLDDLLVKYRNLWSGYKGISDGSKYRILSNLMDDRKALKEFLDKHNADPDKILKATKEYIKENAVNKLIKYCPKSASFIRGTDNRQYLLEYYLNMDKNEEIKKDIKSTGEEKIYNYSNFMEL